MKKKRIHQYKYANSIILNHSNLSLPVNFIEYWETTQWISPKGEMKETKRHFSWATGITLNGGNVEVIMRGGRVRWKIENETFNTLKNQGYEFEHNFGHGYKSLTNVLSNIMMIVFLFDQLQEIGCDLFKKVYASCFNRRLSLWRAYQALHRFSGPIEGWDMFMRVISEDVDFEPVNTS